MYKAMMLSVYGGPQLYLTGRSIMCSAFNYYRVLISFILIGLNSWLKFLAPKLWPGLLKIFLVTQLAPEKFWLVCMPDLKLCPSMR